MWNILSGKSLWAKLFSAKFLSKRHLSRSSGYLQSKSYKVLAPWFDTVVLNSQKLIRSGNHIDFWCNKWMGTGPLILRLQEVPTRFPKFSEVYNNSQWDLGGVDQWQDESDEGGDWLI